MRPVLRYFGRELLGFAGVMLAVCVVVALLAPHLSLFHTYLCMMPTLCIWLPAASQPMGGSLHRNLPARASVAGAAPASGACSSICLRWKR